VPVEAESVLPTWVVPLAVGGEVFAGRPSAVTVEVGSEVATVEPAVFEAVTLTRSV
jgi:hypothetical protein